MKILKLSIGGCAGWSFVEVFKPEPDIKHMILPILIALVIIQIKFICEKNK